MKKLILPILILSIIFNFSTVNAQNTDLNKVVSKLLQYTAKDRADLFYTLGNGYLTTDVGLKRLMEIIDASDDSGPYEALINSSVQAFGKENIQSFLKKLTLISEDTRQEYFKYFDRIVDEQGNFSPKDEIKLKPENEQIISQMLSSLCDDSPGLERLLYEDGITPGVVARFLKIFCDMNESRPLLTDSSDNPDKFGVYIISDSLKSKENYRESIDSIVNGLNKSALTKSLKPVFEELGIYAPKSITTWSNPFFDVSINDWFYDSVKFVSSNNLMKGTDYNKFSPNEEVTRAMFVTLLYRMENEPYADNSEFNDVSSEDYFNKAVSWASEKEIVKGVSPSLFAPHQAITREQMVTIIYRYLNYKGKSNSGGNINLKEVYDDYNLISEYAITSFSFCVSNKIVMGKTATTLNPQDTSIRAEAATVLIRICNFIK